MSYVPELVALDAMKANGYDVTQTQFASDSLTGAALATNAVQLDAGDTVGFSNMIANTPIKMIDARQNNEWSFVTTADITDCAQLTGKKVGYFNLTGVSTAYPTAYFSQHCPDVKPDVVLIPDSGLRAQAMAAGQLDATPLQLNDAIALLAQNPGKFHTLVNFATELEGIGRDFIATNEDTLNNHPTQLQEFVKQHLLAIRSFYEQPGVALAAAQKYLTPDPSMETIVQAYVDGKLWCANGGLQDGALGKALGYLQGFGLVTGPTSEAVYLAPAPLLGALQDIGTSTDTDC